MNIIFKIIKYLYNFSLYLGLLFLIVIIPLWVMYSLIPYIEKWRLLIAYISFVAVYIEITNKYFKLKDL